MKNANKRLLISIAALVIAIALAATTTFAWFTMDTTPEINKIDLTVTAQDGLYISLTGTDGDYYTNLNVTDESASLKLDAVTLKKPTALDAAEGVFTKIKDGTTVTSEDSSEYYSKEFFIRSQSNYSVHISNITIKDVTNPTQNIVAWRNFTTAADGFEATKGTALPVQALIQNAIRVGFAVGNEMVKIVNPNAGAGWEDSTYTFNGDKAAHDYYKTVTQMSADDKGAFDNDWKDPVYTAIDKTKLASYGAVGNTVDNQILATLGTADASLWYKQTIKVYIWAEGTDADCFNEILKTGFTVNIELSGTYISGT